MNDQVIQLLFDDGGDDDEDDGNGSCFQYMHSMFKCN